MLTFTNVDLRAKVRAALGAEAAAEAEQIDFLTFPDLAQSVRDDVAFLRDSPLIPDSIIIRGFIYDVRRGTLTEVDSDPVALPATSIGTRKAGTDY